MEGCLVTENHIDLVIIIILDTVLQFHGKLFALYTLFRLQRLKELDFSALWTVEHGV